MNNREWAILIWVGVFVAWALTHRDIRSSFVDVLRGVAKPKTLVPLGLMAGWVAFEVWLGSQVEIWTASLLKDTAIWLVTSGLVLFFNFGDASKDPNFFRRKAMAALLPIALLVVVLDSFVLPLIAEIILQLVLAILVMLAAVASTDQRLRSVEKSVRGLIGLIGLLLITRAVVNLITGWDELDKNDLLLEVILPGWLTIGLLPFIYVVALYAAYELAFLRVNWKSSVGRLARLRTELALLMGLHVNAHEIASFAGYWPQRLAAASSFSEARNVVWDFRSARQEAARAATEAGERLIRFAGVDGVDEHGKRLDRREFKATAESLRWLAVCMMGWYRHKNRYQPDLVERLGDDFTRQGLAKPSGITMRVSKDGKAWYAWRRTITGWCFAIGAAGPPSKQWEYDGSDPPGGFPGADKSWGTQAFSNEANLNW